MLFKFASFFTTDRPIPVPSLPRDKVVSTCSKFSNIVSILSFGIPIPVSFIDIQTFSFSISKFIINYESLVSIDENNVIKRLSN